MDKNKEMKDREEKTKEKKASFLQYFQQLPIQKLAAGFIGVDENTITNWKKADSEFSDQVETAKSQWALDNAKKVRSKEWLLERIMNDHFGDKKQFEVSLKDLIEDSSTYVK